MAEHWSCKPRVGSAILPVTSSFESDAKNQTKKCHLLGLNQGPSDLQSDALPTELKRLLLNLSTGGADAGPRTARARPEPKGTSSGDRTHDHKIKSLALYHLSYEGLLIQTTVPVPRPLH